MRLIGWAVILCSSVYTAGRAVETEEAALLRFAEQLANFDVRNALLSLARMRVYLCALFN